MFLHLFPVAALFRTETKHLGIQNNIGATVWTESGVSFQLKRFELPLPNKNKNNVGAPQDTPTFSEICISSETGWHYGANSQQNVFDAVEMSLEPIEQSTDM